jgi:hypothetical protein
MPTFRDLKTLSTAIPFLVLMSLAVGPGQALGQGSGEGGMQRGPDGAGMQHRMKRRGARGESRHGCHGKGRSDHLLGPSWRATLSAEQKQSLDKLHVAYAKKTAQLKATIEGLRIQLAVLATENPPHTKAMDAKIEELLGVERELLKTRYAYIFARRALLRPEQQASFDMSVMRRVMRGDTYKRHGGH